MNKPNASPRTLQRLLPLLATCLLTMGGHAGAVTFPNTPLESGGQYPPPNVMFILDDSGSMAWRYMYNPEVTGIRYRNSSGNWRTSDATGNNISSNASYTPTSDSVDGIYDQNAVTNSIYYNPDVTYLPWKTATGARRTGGTSYRAVYTSDTHASGSTADLSNYTITYYAPKSPGMTNTQLGDIENYYRYQIHTNGSIIRSEYGNTTEATDWQELLNTLVSLSGSGSSREWIVNVPEGVDELEVSLSGQANRADLYVRNPANTSWSCAITGNSTNYCLLQGNVGSGNRRIRVERQNNNFSNYRLIVRWRPAAPPDGCGGLATTPGWRNCTSATPTGRTEAQERENFAIWYSYHRTRTKVAKAGASEAFSELDAGFRVGYDSIWNRSAFPIPVGTSDGAFANADGTANANRTTWFERLHDATASNGTPLHGALQRTGEYYRSTQDTGPWGPDHLSCRQSFAILTTDGFWNTRSSSGYYTSVGDQDGVAGSTITSPTGRTFQYQPSRPYCDNGSGNCGGNRSDTLADVAMKYWKTDLRPDLDNNVASSSDDPAFWQHMVTFGISIGLRGSLDPKADLASLRNGSKRWPDPNDDEDLHRIDDLWHAAINGRGAFAAASRPAEFQQALQEAFSIVAQRQGSASNVTANSTSFSSDTLVFQAKYVTGKWVGELEAYNASAAGVASTPSWVASEVMPAPAARKFFTFDGTAGTTFPTATQLAALDQSSRANGPVDAAGNVAYLKGTQTGERQNGGDLRNRDAVLGDIVNSSPFYSPDMDTLFVGANDGMLHAFDASSGAELFAYVPASLNFSSLASLSDPYYQHRYFVDGPVVVSSRRQTPGKNYLVGSLGRGGRALFGLDVTEPDAFAADDVLWEFTHADLGNVLGEPLIATLNGGTKVVIVGNGPNSSSGNAKLLVLNIATGALLQSIDTGVGGDNGLFDPRGADLDGNGTVDVVYAGDMKGNLWKFDFSSATGSVALGGTPLFTAASPAGDVQPITSGLALGQDPATRKIWVFFGTGRFMTAADPIDDTIQTVYGIIDDEPDATLTRNDLKERDIIAVETVDGTSLRGFEPTGPLDDEEGWFLDLDTPTAGERVVNRPQLRGTVLIFSSRIPPTDNACDAGGSGYLNALQAFTGASTDDPYFDADGDGDVDEDDTIVGTGDHAGTTVPVGSIDLGVGMPTLPTIIDELAVVCGSTGECNDVTVNPQGAVRRRASWREIIAD